jgi:hypothetical protein
MAQPKPTLRYKLCSESAAQTCIFPWLEHSVPSVVLELALEEVSALNAEQNNHKPDRSQLFALYGVPLYVGVVI